ncbi:cytochrome P450 [Favolaschia claudopus]|uniref:Cytochrome P450 n=1 Tax=Favolaschia claudopus TaxID=2862362 RepID=A0AAW0A7W3_9AGAR
MNYLVAFIPVTAAVLLVLISRHRGSTIRHVPGPPSTSWIFGNMLQLILPPQHGDYEYSWLNIYGSVYRFKGCFGNDRLMVADPTALKHIVNSPDFVFGPTLDILVQCLFGERSVMAREGTDHQRLRAGLNPGFTAAAVRSYQPIFEKVAQGITEKLEHESESFSTDISALFSSAAFDAISEVALGCPTGNLDPKFVKTNLEVSHLTLSQSASAILGDALLGILPPYIRHKLILNLPTKNLRLLHAQRALATEAGARAVCEKRDLLAKGGDATEDVFTLLVDSVSTGALGFEDISGQTSLLMLAGGETTANTLAFGLFELARDSELQQRLRVEIQDALGAATNPTSISYDNLPLLNAVIKESLRMYPVIPFPERVAATNTVIHLSHEITLTNGQRVKQIPIRKGQVIMTGIGSFQRIEEIWGRDANKFRPGRWLDGSMRSAEAVGPFANLLSFSGGARTCLGWRFAVLEMQVILCELLSKFSFTLPAGHFHRIRFVGVLQPLDEKGDKRLSLCVKRIL